MCSTQIEQFPVDTLGFPFSSFSRTYLYYLWRTIARLCSDAICMYFLYLVYNLDAKEPV